MHQVQWRVDGKGMVRKSLLALARLPWPRSTPAPRVTAAAWATLATASVLSALQLAIAHDWQTDLHEVQTWIAVWTTGASPYRAIYGVDYPPHAFGVLWFFSLSSSAQGFAINAWFNAALSVAGCYLLVRWFAQLSESSLSRLETTSFVCMLLSSRAVRRSIGFGQTFPLVLILFITAMLLARRRPVLAGLCFALASFKLNLAAGFGLALLLLGHTMPLVVAGVIVVALTMAFAWSVHEPVVAVMSSYADSFIHVYGGVDFLIGVTGLRSALTALVSDFRMVQLTYPFAIGVLLVILVGLSLRRRPDDARLRAIAVVACLLWSFASLTHQRHNTLLLFHAVWIVQWADRGVLQNRFARWALSTGALLLLVINIPDSIESRLVEVSARLPASFQLIGGAIARLINEHGTRVVVLISLFLVLRSLAMAPALSERRGGDQRTG